MIWVQWSVLNFKGGAVHVIKDERLVGECLLRRRDCRQECCKACGTQTWDGGIAAHWPEAQPFRER